MTETELKELLDSEAERINSPEFIADDPVQFPRMFTDLRDIEIVALLAATIAWGNRKMICRDCGRLLEIMQEEPYAYIMSGAFEELDPDRNIHRTFFARDLQWWCRGMRGIYRDYPSLDSFSGSIGAGETEAPAWSLVAGMLEVFGRENEGKTPSRSLSSNLAQSALKRVNMALRWLVRRDGIVDLGVWESITPDKLYIPLDVHVGNVSRGLGLLERKSNDRKAVEQLTTRLRRWRPDDPVVYDYALFGIGVSSKSE